MPSGVGVFWTVSGVLHLMGAFSSPDLPNRGWAIFNGLLSVIAGIVIFAFPINSAFALAIVLGAWLAILGIMEIGASMRLRRISSTVEEFRGRGAVAPAG